MSKRLCKNKIIMFISDTKIWIGLDFLKEDECLSILHVFLDIALSLEFLI